jgi:hypothetical protein
MNYQRMMQLNIEFWASGTFHEFTPKEHLGLANDKNYEKVNHISGMCNTFCAGGHCPYRHVLWWMQLGSVLRRHHQGLQAEARSWCDLRCRCNVRPWPRMSCISMRDIAIEW